MKVSEETHHLVEGDIDNILKTVESADPHILRRFEFWLCKIVNDKQESLLRRERSAFALQCIYGRFPRGCLANDCRALRTVQVLAETSLSLEYSLSFACLRALLAVIGATTTLPPEVGETVLDLLERNPHSFSMVAQTMPRVPGVQ